MVAEMPTAFASSRVPEPSVFGQMDRAKAEAAGRGLKVVNMSIGTSDLCPPPEALDALRQSIDDPATHGYLLKSGTTPLLEAACSWFKRRYDVTIDPATEALSLVGSQEGLAHLLLAVCDHGDTILTTNPAYPSYFGAIKIAGLRPVYMPLGADFLPQLQAISEEDAQRARVMLLNYPNNPTCAVASPKFFAATVAFCRQHDILLIHDSPYVDYVYDAPTAASPLAVEGAKDVVVELFSFAKSFHLGGFRLGFALGNAGAIAALEATKAAVDFNQYLGIQRMGVACLQLPEERVRGDAKVWQGRARAMCSALQQCGWDVQEPSAGMYIWAKLPQGVDDLEFCKRLVAETGVALSPGRGFGESGVGYIRVALVQPEQVLRKCAQQIVSVLRDMQSRQQAPSRQATRE